MVQATNILADLICAKVQQFNYFSSDSSISQDTDDEWERGRIYLKSKVCFFLHYIFLLVACCSTILRIFWMVLDVIWIPVKKIPDTTMSQSKDEILSLWQVTNRLSWIALANSGIGLNTHRRLVVIKPNISVWGDIGYEVYPISAQFG